MDSLHVKGCSYISIRTAAEKLNMSEDHVNALIERGAVDTYTDAQGVVWVDYQCILDILNGATEEDLK